MADSRKNLEGKMTEGGNRGEQNAWHLKFHSFYVSKTLIVRF